MAIGNTPYASDRYGASRELALGRLKAGTDNDAGEVIARHRFFTAVKVLEVSGIVHTVGGADNAFDIYKGTTSIGQIALGTAAAAAVVAASLTDTDFGPTDNLVITQANTTETGAARVMIHYQERFA